MAFPLKLSCGAAFFGCSDFVRFIANDSLEIDLVIEIAEEVIQGGVIPIFPGPAGMSYTSTSRLPLLICSVWDCDDPI